MVSFRLCPCFFGPSGYHVSQRVLSVSFLEFYYDFLLLSVVVCGFIVGVVHLVVHVVIAVFLLLSDLSIFGFYPRKQSTFNPNSGIDLVVLYSHHDFQLHCKPRCLFNGQSNGISH